MPSVVLNQHIYTFLAPFFPDINECVLGTDNCHAQATCTNNVGSFSCACNTGWSGNGVTCVGKNEKLLNQFFIISTMTRKRLCVFNCFTDV